ncbi:MAG TPA: UDP-N-acetylmuramoyl-L-alanine--D-glutamate ligase [Acidimicrobiales bacterium]|nr:UDP-N-acetylmuramoyl-L-alanine--D-glutamate ligase [Acidimicrobiales bacterium]
MRHPISWSELTSASVGVWGLGVEGSASVRRLQSMGSVPVLVEDEPAAPAMGDLEVLSTAQGGLPALLRCDVVIKSPGISRYRPEVAQLESAGVPVRGGLGLWLQDADRAGIACITGTKGKSTTTALAVHLLTRLGYDARAGGNIGRPPWDPSAEQDPAYWVIETSSFQVPDLTCGPPVVAVTSLSPDHLDWHGSVERYYADKLSLCTKPGVTLAIAEGSDPLLRAHAAAMGPHLRWVGRLGAAPVTTWSHALALPGLHNARNASIARAVLVGLGIAAADDDDAMTAAAVGFAGLPSRCRSLGHIGATEFVDDSLSTNVLPAQAALAAFDDRPVALLVGGHDRGLDYTPLGQSVAQRVQRMQPTLVVTMPDNGPRIGHAIRQVAGDQVEMVDADDLADAVAIAFAWAESGGVVLLSPAAPSFGRYHDYRDRARAFAEAAARCGTLS